MFGFFYMLFLGANFLVYPFLFCLFYKGCKASAAIEPIVSPVILNAWASHISDPFISSDVIEILEVIMLTIVGNFPLSGIFRDFPSWFIFYFSLCSHNPILTLIAVVSFTLFFLFYFSIKFAWIGLLA